MLPLVCVAKSFAIIWHEFFEFIKINVAQRDIGKDQEAAGDEWTFAAEQQWKPVEREEKE